jgi:hypothetical protein
MCATEQDILNQAHALDILRTNGEIQETHCYTHADHMFAVMTQAHQSGSFGALMRQVCWLV